MQAYDYSKLSVLVVDDSSYMRQLLRTVLQAIGCVTDRVFTAPDAAKAIGILCTDHVDIVILDWIMRPVNGIELTRTIRTGGKVPNPFVPIIMLTGFAKHSAIMAARDAGVTEYLAKPVTAKCLLDRINAVIENPRPFVRTERFMGPDRRRKDTSLHGGPERRAETPGEKDIFMIEDEKAVDVLKRRLA